MSSTPGNRVAGTLGCQSGTRTIHEVFILQGKRNYSALMGVQGDTERSLTRSSRNYFPPTELLDVSHFRFDRLPGPTYTSPLLWTSLPQMDLSTRTSVITIPSSRDRIARVSASRGRVGASVCRRRPIPDPPPVPPCVGPRQRGPDRSLPPAPVRSEVG